jgi:hypothetical protein
MACFSERKETAEGMSYVPSFYMSPVGNSYSHHVSCQFQSAPFLLRHLLITKSFQFSYP